MIGESMQIELKRPRKGEGESSETLATEEDLARFFGVSKGIRFPSQQIELRKIASWSRAAATRLRSSINGPNVEQYKSSISPIRVR